MAENATPTRRSSRRDTTSGLRTGNGSSDAHSHTADVQPTTPTTTTAAAEAVLSVEASPTPLNDTDPSTDEPASGSARRSRRHVKSTYATYALTTTASASTPPPASTATPPASIDSPNEPKRRRSSSSSTKPPPPPLELLEPVEQPVLVVVPQLEPTPAARPQAAAARRRRPPPASLEPTATHDDADAAADDDNNSQSTAITTKRNDTAPLTGNVTQMGDRAVSQRHQLRKALGRYTARECTLLCEAILQQLKRQSLAPTALDSDVSPATIPWDAIAAKLLKTHRLSITPCDAQRLWKFLAYAEQPQTSSDATDTDNEQLAATSDAEDFARPVATINATHRAQKDAEKVATAAAAATGDLEPLRLDSTAVDASMDPPVASEPIAASSSSSAGFTLYPQYDLTTAVPSMWPRNELLSSKAMLPLTFAASTFLRLKPGAIEPVVSSLPALAAATANVPSLAVRAAGGANTNATRTIDAAASVAQQQPPPIKKKRTYTRRVHTATHKKPRSGSSSSSPSTIVGGHTNALIVAAAAAAAGTSSNSNQSTTPTTSMLTALQAPKQRTGKSPFVPSTTPPPLPPQPRAAFQFFCRLFDDNVASTAPSTAPSSTGQMSPPPLLPPRVQKTPSELHALFVSAPPHVKSACEKYALEDLDRYNRACVRRRIWEKAMATATAASASNAASVPLSVSASPASAPPAVASAPAPAPAPTAPAPTAPVASMPVLPFAVPMPATSAAPAAPGSSTGTK